MEYHGISIYNFTVPTSTFFSRREMLVNSLYVTWSIWVLNECTGVLRLATVLYLHLWRGHVATHCLEQMLTVIYIYLSPRKPSINLSTHVLKAPQITWPPWKTNWCRVAYMSSRTSRTYTKRIPGDLKHACIKLSLGKQSKKQLSINDICLNSAQKRQQNQHFFPSKAAVSQGFSHLTGRR